MATGGSKSQPPQPAVSEGGGGALSFCPHCGRDFLLDEPMQIGRAVFDPGRGLYYDGRPVRLTAQQRILAASLMKAEGSVVSRFALIERMGIESGSDNEDNILSVQTKYLRRCLASVGADRHVQTVRGLGLRWAA